MRRLLTTTLSCLVLFAVAVSSAHSAATVGQPVPAFSLLDLSGTTHTPEKYRGKVLVTWIVGYNWAICTQAGPDLEENMFQPNKNKNVQFLALDIWNGSTAQAFNFVNITGISFPMLQKAAANPETNFGLSTGAVVISDTQGIVKAIYGEQDHGLVTQMIDLILTQKPLAIYTPQDLYFGLKMQVGQTKTIPVKIDNNGVADLEVSSITSSNPELQVDKTSLTIAPNTRGEVIVSAVPTGPGTLTGTITLKTNDPTQPTIQLPMEAITVEGALPGAISLPVSSLAFGEFEVGKSAQTSVTVTNNGQGPLNLTGFETTLAGVSADVEGVTIAVGQSVDIAVILTASGEGALSGTLTLLSDDPTNGRVDLTLSGSAIVVLADPRADFNGNGTIDFGDFVQFAQAFGSTQVAFDLSGNGSVDFGDFVVFAQNFGRSVN